MPWSFLILGGGGARWSCSGVGSAVAARWRLPGRWYWKELFDGADHGALGEVLLHEWQGNHEGQARDDDHGVLGELCDPLRCGIGFDVSAGGAGGRDV